MRKSLVVVAGKDPLQEVAGGHSSYVRAHARAAARTGFEPHLFCVSASEGEVATDYGIVHRLRSPYRHFLNKSPGSAFKVATAPMHESLLARGVKEFLERHEGRHVIHGFGVWTSAAVRARAALNSTAIRHPVLASVYSLLDHEHDGKILGLVDDHGLRHQLVGRIERWWINYALSRAEQRAYCGADRILVNYEAVRALLEARFGKKLSISKIAYTSETAILPRRDAEEPVPEILSRLEPRDAPLIVAVSRHDPRKGLHVLLRSLARLKELGVPFRACLIGRGQLLEEHRRMMRELCLERETVITGLVDDPGLFLRRADIFVLPSLEEGSGSVSLIEALQSGVACVASAIDGIPEDLTEGESGLLVEPGSVDSLTEALRQVLVNKVLRARLRTGARSRFDEKFASDGFATSLREVYEDCLALP